MNLLNAVGMIKGIGAKREKLFQAKGIYTIQDLLFYVPKTFKDYSKILTIAEVGEQEALMLVTVTTAPKLSYYQNKSLVRFKVKDSSAEADVYFFNMPYMVKQVTKGETLYIYDKVAQKNDKKLIVNPHFERNADTIKEFPLVPVYPQIHGISQHMLIKTMQMVLALIKEETDYLSDAFKEAYHLPDLYDAHRRMHFPDSFDTNSDALKRFAIEELLVFLCMLDEQTVNAKQTDIRLEISALQKQAFITAAGFEFTNAQVKVMDEISHDLNSGRVMNRLVQGDVGSGKTITAFYAMFINAVNGYQSVMMAPTEILARQHYNDARAFFEPLGISVGLITGSDSAAQRKETLAKAGDGTLDIVIGTHALIYGDIGYKNINLAVTDEQHRFGVSQRAKISYQNRLNMLVMSATPIPRTLALVLFSDMNVSVIDEMPKGRQPVDTHIITENKRGDMYGFIKDEIKKGHQAYVVCPLIESEDDDKTVTDIYDEITRDFGINRCAILHGQMRGEEKASIVNRFLNRELDLLVSSTVIEVGVNVPNATMMIVEGADRFGLSTLHQLRGRVGRGSEKSYCFLVCDRITERLEVLKQERDGFKLAEKDLELRGPGQFLGYSQHGIGDFYMSKLIKDMQSLNLAKSIIEKMKTGAFQKEYQMAKRMAKKKFENLSHDIAMN